MIRILLIDDRQSVLQNLEGLIELEEELIVVGTTKNPEQGIELVEQLQPDVAIVDLTMPLKDGIETTYSITQNYPQTKVIILTGSDGRMLNKAILAGAKGYLLKDSFREDLIAAIYAVKRNSVYIGKGILDQVQLSSIDSQRLKLKQINLWLAREVINWWCEHSLVQTPSAKQIIESLSLDSSGLSWMKDYLCRQKDTELTLTDEIRLKVDRLFVGIEESGNIKQLIEKKPQISNWLEGENNTDYLTRLRNNSQSLQTTILKKLQKTISSLWQQAAPLPLVSCLQSVENYLLNWQRFFQQEYENSLVKKNAAWHSFDYLLSSKDSRSNQQELLKKAVMFIYQCKMNAELNSLLSQLVLKIIQQLKIYLNILDRTINLLSNSQNQLKQQNTPEVITLTLFFEQLQEKVSLKELRRDFETSVGHSLNQWGVSPTISNSEINHRLREKLSPITQEIYTSLRKEALAISFLEYAEHSNHKSTIKDELLIDYWKT